MVAATSLMSTRIVRVLPSRSNSCSCKHAQELRLQLERNVADFVQEQRPAVRQLEAADLLRDGAGKRPLLVTEQLALQEAGGDGRAVQLDERARATPAQIVDRAGDQLFARARLPLNQDRRICRSDDLDLLAARA